MKTTEIIVIIHFLEILRKQTENEQLKPITSRGFEYLLSKEELIAIVNHMYDGKGSGIHDLETKTAHELLKIIDDEYYILCYYIEEVLGRYML